VLSITHNGLLIHTTVGCHDGRLILTQLLGQNEVLELTVSSMMEYQEGLIRPEWIRHATGGYLPTVFAVPGLYAWRFGVFGWLIGYSGWNFANLTIPPRFRWHWFLAC